MFKYLDIIVSLLLQIAVSPIANSVLTSETYLVKLKDGVSVSSHLENFQVDFALEENNYKLINTFDIGSFQGYSIEIIEASFLGKLRTNRDVDFFERDQAGKITGQVVKKPPLSFEDDSVEDNDVDAAALQRNPPWNLARISQRKLPLRNWYKYYNSSGFGVDVYIFDTGVRITHEEFEGRAVWGASFTGENVETDNSVEGHGTHVAATVAGKTFGVAKKANIIAVKVSDKNGSTWWSNVVKALEWTLKRFKSRGRKPSVINMSFSGSLSRTLDAAIDSLIKEGIHIVVAAGNNNYDACQFSPASNANAFTVGMSMEDDQMHPDSNFGRCVDILAPGNNIKSAGNRDDTSNQLMVGTSMAAPHIAGLKALFLAKHTFSVFGLDKYMISTSTKLPANKIKSGTINALAYHDYRTESTVISFFEREKERQT